MHQQDTTSIVSNLAAAPSVVASRGVSTSGQPPPQLADQPVERTRCSTSFARTRPFPDWTCCPRCPGCRPSCPTAAGPERCRAEWRSRAGRCPRPRPAVRAVAVSRPCQSRANWHLVLKIDPIKVMSKVVEELE